MHTISDENLRSLRASLLAREDELRARVRRAQEEMRREAAPLSRDGPDAAVAVENDEILQAVDESARAEIAQIERAFERLESGTYARCERCGEGIDLERLRVVPYALHCRRCASDT